MKTLDFDQITYFADGSISLKLRKLVEIDGKVQADLPHRVTVLPDQTVEEVMATVNEALGKEGWAPLPVKDIERATAVKTVMAVAEEKQVDDKPDRQSR